VNKIIWSCIFRSSIVGPAFSGPPFSSPPFSGPPFSAHPSSSQRSVTTEQFWFCVEYKLADTWPAPFWEAWGRGGFFLGTEHKFLGQLLMLLCKFNCKMIAVKMFSLDFLEAKNTFGGQLTPYPRGCLPAMNWEIVF